MNRILKLMTATAVGAALSLAAASSQAAIFVAYSTDGGVTKTDISGSLFELTPGTFVFGGSVTGFTFSGSGTLGLYPDLLLSNSIDTVATGGAGQLDIYITNDGLTQGTGKFISGLTANGSRNALPVTLTTLVSATNQKFDGVVLAGPQSYTSATTQSNDFLNSGPISPLYSVTAQYHVSSVGEFVGDAANATVNISAAVPEPATWGLMIMGFGGAGAMLRSRRKGLVAA